MKQSFEYFSLHYLDMWLKHDRLYHDSINNGTREEKLNAIKKALAYYKVARTLPKEHDETTGCDRYGPILKIIDKVVASDFSTNPVKSILKVREKISKAYGGRNVLSVTSKLLWLKIRDPIIIYDSQARKALDTPGGNFQLFYDEWQNKYEEHSHAIDNACSKLSKVAKYAYDQTTATPIYVKNISAQPWFKERVFDTYLWHKGL